MNRCKIEIKGFTPYSQSKKILSDKHKRENDKDYEERTWRERIHAGEDGIAFIPRMAIKNCLSECAKYLGMQIPGKGKNTYTKHFEAGIIPENDISLNVHKDKVEGEWLYLNSDGQRGGKRRVFRCMPKFTEWGGEMELSILDPAITKEVFEYHIREAGRFIGIGRWRPRNNGLYGRFDAEIIEWE